jgi:hypothetical protein
MIFNELNEDNFLLFAIKHYENPQAVTREDFDKDLNHFKYIKRLLKRYKNNGELKTHLLLNHFIILYNVFGEATTPMLFFKIEKDLWSSMKSFVIFLGRFPEYPKSSIHDIEVDVNCLSQLYKIYNGKEET